MDHFQVTRLKVKMVHFAVSQRQKHVSVQNFKRILSQAMNEECVL